MIEEDIRWLWCEYIWAFVMRYRLLFSWFYYSFLFYQIFVASYFLIFQYNFNMYFIFQTFNMVELTPLGTEFEAIIVGVLVFILGGAMMFFCCFIVTHMYLFYKSRVIRKKKRHKKNNDDSNNVLNNGNSQFGYAPLKTEVTVDSEQSSENNV